MCRDDEGIGVNTRDAYEVRIAVEMAAAINNRDRAAFERANNAAGFLWDAGMRAGRNANGSTVESLCEAGHRATPFMILGVGHGREKLRDEALALLRSVAP